MIPLSICSATIGYNNTVYHPITNSKYELLYYFCTVDGNLCNVLNWY